jgi:hypothetical protein
VGSGTCDCGHRGCRYRRASGPHPLRSRRAAAFGGAPYGCDAHADCHIAGDLARCHRYARSGSRKPNGYSHAGAHFYGRAATNCCPALTQRRDPYGHTDRAHTSATNRGCCATSTFRHFYSHTQTEAHAHASAYT